MASLQLDQAPGKKRWLPVAIVAAIAASVLAYSVLDSSDEQPVPLSHSSDKPASAQNLEQAFELTRDGRHREALNTVNQLLTERPDDMHALLLQATLLAKTGNTAEAERRLHTLRQQYPDRPEPLNNLAVLYAEAGDSSRAIQTLQKAFKTHPSYDLVYQNLSDMYALLAAQAYNKALGVSGSKGGPQLATLHRFGTPSAIPDTTSLISIVPPAGNNAVNEAPPVVTATPTVVETAVAAEQPAVNADAAKTALEEPEAEAVEAPTEQPPYTNVVLNPADSEAINAAQSSSERADDPDDTGDSSVLSATPEELAIARETERAAQLLASLETGNTPVIEEEPTEEPVPQQEIADHLLGWAKAWSDQDIDAYVRAYVAGYKPDSGTTHKQWADLRRSRLAQPSFIKVELRDIEVTMLSDTKAEATFIQRYSSDRYRDVERKRVSLMRRSSGWKIVQEGKL